MILPRPFEFLSLNGCQSVNFGAFPFGSESMKYCFSKCFCKLSSQSKAFFVINVNAILTLQLRPHAGPLSMILMHICASLQAHISPCLRTLQREFCWAKGWASMEKHTANARNSRISWLCKSLLFVCDLR